MQRSSRLALLTGLVAWLAAGGAAAVTLGVVSDFETDAEGWAAGSPDPNPPVVAPDGGPGGAGDAFLRATGNGGFGAGSKLVLFNATADWTGNYSAAGVAALEMDLRNLTETALQIRIEIEGAPISLSENRVVSIASAQLAALQDWTHVRIPIDLAGLTGGLDVAAALADVRQIRIMHNPQATSSRLAPRIAGQLGIDNVTAVPVPEPGSALLLGAALAGLAARRQRRRARTSPRSG